MPVARTGDHPRILELFAAVERNRGTHETSFECFERLVLEAMVAERMQQTEMAGVLNCTKRSVNYKLAKYMLRDIDKRPKLRIVGCA